MSLAATFGFKCSHGHNPDLLTTSALSLALLSKSTDNSTQTSTAPSNHSYISDATSGKRPFHLPPFTLPFLSSSSCNNFELHLILVCCMSSEIEFLFHNLSKKIHSTLRLPPLHSLYFNPSLHYLNVD